jgi:hypothetical protein
VVTACRCRQIKEKIGWHPFYASDGSARSYFPIESGAGSLPESLAVRHLVPLLPWLRPRSTHDHLCVIYNCVVLNKSRHIYRLNAYTAVGSCVLGHNWEIMKRNASALHKPRNVRSARIAVKPSLKALYRTRSFRRTFGPRSPTRGIIIAIETF